MVLRLRVWAIAALVAAGLSPAVAHGAAKPIKTVALVDTGVVQPGKDNGFEWRCPKSAPHPVAMQAWSRTDGAIALDEARSFARGRGWVMGVRGMSDRPQAYSVGPICLRAAGRFAYPTVSGALDPGASATWTVTCPRRAPIALNGTLEPQNGSDVGQIVMTESVMLATRGATSRRWDVGVRNLDLAAPHSFWVGAVCTNAKARYVSMFSDALTLQPQQTDGATGRCPKRAPHPISSMFYPRDDAGEGQFTLDEVALYGRREITTLVTNRSSSPQRYFVGNICIGDRHPARQRPPLRRVTASSRPRISGST